MATRKAPAKKAPVRKAKTPAIAPAPKRRIRLDALAGAGPARSHADISNVVDFQTYSLESTKPLPGVVPPVAWAEMANDAGIQNAFGFANAAFGAGSGFFWPGYTVLAEWAQRPEYRRIAETISKECTRRWIKLHTSGDGDKSAKIKKMNAEIKRLKVRDAYRECIQQDGLFGRSHIYIDTGHTEDRDELVTPLFVDKAKVGIGGLKRLRVVEPMWTYPGDYNAIDPLTPDYYRPTTWWVMSKKIHSTRLQTMVLRDVPDLLKPAFQFGGLSMSQMLKPYVDNWLRTRQSVSDLLHSFSVSGIKTNMDSVLQGGTSDSLITRAELFNRHRDNRGLFLLDKETEEFFNVTTPLSSLDKLQAQSQEHISSIAGIPLTILLGITPSGLNASSEGEIRTFYAWIEAIQEDFIRDPLTRILKLIQLSLFGSIDPDIDFSFVPLWSLDDAALATKRKTEADTASVYVNAGIVSPDEERQRLAQDDEGIYSNIDLSTPAPPPPGAEGEDGPGIGHNGGPGLETDDEDESDDLPGNHLPWGGSDKPKPSPTVAKDADPQWNEDKHHRGQPGNAGQFGAGGSGPTSKPLESKPSGPKPPDAGNVAMASLFKSVNSSKFSDKQKLDGLKQFKEEHTKLGNKSTADYADKWHSIIKERLPSEAPASGPEVPVPEVNSPTPTQVAHNQTLKGDMARLIKKHAVAESEYHLKRATDMPQSFAQGDKEYLQQKVDYLKSRPETDFGAAIKPKKKKPHVRDVAKPQPEDPPAAAAKKQAVAAKREAIAKNLTKPFDYDQAATGDKAKADEALKSVVPTADKDLWKSVPGKQKAALKSYTNEGYAFANNVLRGISTEDEATGEAGFDVGELIAHINDAFDSPISRLSADLQVHRVTDLAPEMVEALTEALGRGESPMFQQGGFLSTTVSSDATNDFENRNVMMHITVGKSTPALFLNSVSQFADQDEILLKHGQQIRITGLKQDPDTEMWHVTGETA